MEVGARQVTTTNQAVCKILARALRLDPEHVAAMAGALGMTDDCPATVASAVRLLIALLAADTPGRAVERTDIYSVLPLTHAIRSNIPLPDGTLTNTLVDLADVRPEPGGAQAFERLTRTLAGGLELVVELMIGRDPHILTPYMIRLARRSLAPHAMIGATLPDRSDEVLLYRQSGDGEADYWMAGSRLTIFADAHGSVLEALADLFRENERTSESEAATDGAAAVTLEGAR
jgi:hypothetical protein